MEIVGTAVALHILLRLPLWAGVLMTATDTFTFMMIQRYGIRRLEAFFMVLITMMAVCFWVELVQSQPDVGKIIQGVIVPYVPKNAELQAVAMLGAIVMPHNMFLHSALVMSRDLGRQPSIRKLKEANFYFAIESILALSVSFFVNLAIVVVFAQGNSAHRYISDSYILNLLLQSFSSQITLAPSKFQAWTMLMKC